MTHRFPIKEIARQSGLGTATIDRVLNGRAHVSAQTRARVAAAVSELEAQEMQLAAKGRRLFFDVIVEAPRRFSREVRAAAQAVIPQIGTAVCRPRFVLQQIMEEDEVVAALMRVQKRGSHGVCLKARDTPRIREMVARLAAARIPVVTLVTDIGSPARLAYVGSDNAGAGRTAAYLIAQVISEGQVLTTLSHEKFLGEEERAKGFAQRLAQLRPQVQIVSVQGGSGVDFETMRALEAVQHRIGDLRAVYSMGGGNRSILQVLERIRARPQIYVAHDLDRDNRHLIEARLIDFVLHHDLRIDLRRVFDAFLAYHGLLVSDAAVFTSAVQVITPENIPPDLRGDARGWI
ncbi:MAG: LacI family DNA-binding transcriptional regulator [Pseudomonadota bacterium]